MKQKLYSLDKAGVEEWRLDNLERDLGVVKDFMPINYKWEEDGQRFSVWEFKTEGLSITTGDGGAGLFNKTLMKEINKIYGR